MGEFRRFIMSVVAGLEVLFVISTTLLGGIVACIVPAITASVTGQGGGLALVCFIVGAVGGFCISALMVSISVNLAQIAENTAVSKKLLQEAALRNGPVTQRSLSPVSETPTPQPRLFVENAPTVQRESSTPFSNVGAELSERTKAILLKAKEQGYELVVSHSGKAVTIKKDGVVDTFCYSNYDIERFNIFAKVT